MPDSLPSLHYNRDESVIVSRIATNRSNLSENVLDGLSQDFLVRQQHIFLHSLNAGL